MLGPLKRWMNGGPPGPDWRAVSNWAKQRGYGFKRVRDGDGFAIEGVHGQASAAARPPAKPSPNAITWRLEWGPPQRTYITTRELRVKADIELHSGLQMLVLTRGLFEQLEHDTFELFTETLQTQIDSSTPEEMRWLAMFPKVDLNAIRAVRSHLAAVASVPSLAERWMAGPLGVQIGQARLALLGNDVPFLLMAQRTRLQLRAECEFPGSREVEQAVGIFEAALTSALALRDERHAAGAPSSTVSWPESGETG